MGGIDGLKKLERLKVAMGAAFGPAVQARLAQRMAAASIKLLADQFRKSVDPYGNPWAPVVRNRKRDRGARARRARAGRAPRSDKPLVDTGRLRASPVAVASTNLVRVSLPVSYAEFHQSGTKRMPRRQIIPEESTGGLGPRWSAAMGREAERVKAEIKRELRKAAR